MTAESYVFNPINAFHMLKRNSEWLPKLLPNNSLYNQLFFNTTLTLQEAAFGIVDVQEFYDLDINDIINGTLKDTNSGLWHHSENKLSLEEVLLIAEAAKSSNYFYRHVQWLESALSMAKNKKWVKKLQKNVKNAKLMHDNVYKSLLVSFFVRKQQHETLSQNECKCYNNYF